MDPSFYLVTAHILCNGGHGPARPGPVCSVISSPPLLVQPLQPPLVLQMCQAWFILGPLLCLFPPPASACLHDSHFLQLCSDQTSLWVPPVPVLLLNTPAFDFPFLHMIPVSLFLFAIHLIIYQHTISFRICCLSSLNAHPQ